MDGRLSCNQHINKIISKVKPKIGSILRKCSYLPVKSLKSIYAAHILSESNFCITAWTQCSAVNKQEKYQG